MAKLHSVNGHELTATQQRVWNSVQASTGDGGILHNEREKRWNARREQEAHNMEKMPRKKGRLEYIRVLRKEHVSYRQRMLAMCYSCSGGMPDVGCASPTCPLFDLQEKEWKPDYTKGWLK